MQAVGKGEFTRRQQSTAGEKGLRPSARLAVLALAAREVESWLQEDEKLKVIVHHVG